MESIRCVFKNQKSCSEKKILSNNKAKEHNHQVQNEISFKQQLERKEEKKQFFFFYSNNKKTPNIGEVEQSRVLSKLIKLSEDATHVQFCATPSTKSPSKCLSASSVCCDEPPTPGSFSVHLSLPQLGSGRHVLLV